MNDSELVGVVTDPEALWLCGASYIPLIATSYATAGGLMASAGKLPDSAFDRMTSNPMYTGPSPGVVPYYLNQLRDELHRMIGTSVNNLFATGDALEQVAWAYVNTDDAGASALESAVKGHLEDNRTDRDTDTPIWTDKERERQINDRVKAPNEN